jgi:hypothetical protein
MQQEGSYQPSRCQYHVLEFPCLQNSKPNLFLFFISYPVLGYFVLTRENGLIHFYNSDVAPVFVAGYILGIGDSVVNKTQSLPLWNS